MAKRVAPQAEIIIGAGDEASAVFATIVQNAEKMAAKMTEASKKGGDSWKQMGDQGKQTAEKVDAASRSLIQSVQRASAAVEAQMKGSTKGGADYLESLGKIRGETSATFQAEIQRLRGLEAAQKALLLGQQGVEMSAKQTAAALRGVPAQITDIVVSLQGGQAPLTVFLQQGGQLRDMFGSAGAAAKALGGAVLGMVNPLTVALAAIAGIGLAYNQGSKEADAYARSLLMSGNAAGTTASQMQAMAERVSRTVGTQAAAADAIAQLAGTGRVAAADLERFAVTAVRMERDVGVAVKDTVAAFSELGNAPVEASKKLNDQHNYLTASVYSQIKALNEQGKSLDAARVAQDAYNDAMGRVADGMQGRLGIIERAWRDISDAAKKGWDAMLNIGRPDTLSQQIDSVRQKIAQARGQDKNRPFSMPWDTPLGDLEQRLSFLQEQERMMKRYASAKAERNAAEQSAIDAMDTVDKLTESTYTKQDKLNKALESYRKSLDAIRATRPDDKRLDPGQIAKVRANIRAQYADKSGPKAESHAGESELASLKARVEAAKLYYDQLVNMGSGASQLNDGERKSLEIGQQIARTTDTKTLAVLRLQQVQADALGVQLRTNAGLESSIKAHQASIDAIYKDADAIRDRAAAQEAANATYGKSKAAIEAMHLAEMQAQMKEAQGSDSFDEKYIKGLELRIEAQQRWVSALEAGDYKTINAHADKLLANAQEMAKVYADEQQLAGLTAVEREKIVALRQVELKFAKEIAAINMMPENSEEQKALKADAVAKVYQAKRIEDEATVAKVIQADWQKTTDEINRSLTDALLRGFEAGKGFAQNLRDTLKNMFNTLVLRPIISFVMAPVSRMVNGAVQGGMSAMGLGGSNLMGMASNASSLNTLYGTASQALVGGTAGASVASLGYANAVGMLGGDAIGALAAANGMWAGVATGAQAAAQAAVAANTAMAAGTATALEAGTLATAAGAGAGAGAGITSALAAIPGWGWAAMGVLSLLGSGAFSSRGANHSGGVFSTKDADRNAAVASLGLTGDALGDFTTRGNTAIDQQLGVTVGALSNVYQGLAKYAGDSAKQIDIVAGFAVNGKHGDEDAYGYFKLLDKKTGQVLADYVKRDGGLGNDPEKAFAQYSADMGKALVDEIRKADIPKWMDGMFATLDKDVTLDKFNVVLQQVSAAQAAFESFGQYMPTFAAMTMEAQDALVKAAGGVAPLQANMGTFVENFYSDSEKLAIKTENMRQALESLGFEMPKTREEFRDLVQSQLALGEAGAKGAAGLLGLNAAFAEITPATQSAAASVSTLAEQLATAFGTTAESLSGILQDAVKNSETAAEARAAASKAFEEQFYGGALQSLTDSLGSMLQSSVIGPLMESLVAGAAASSATLASGGAMAASAMAAGGVAGASASAAGGSAAAGAMASGGSAAAGAMVSGGSAVGAMVQSAIDQARVQINAYTQILTDPQVQAGIKDISKLMGEVAGLTFTAQQSWESSGGGYSSPGSYSSAADSADKLADSLNKLGETVADEIKRLAGLSNEDDPQKNRAALLAEFAIQTAKAKTGDQDAMGTLTDLSKSIEQATKLTAASAFDLSATRGWLASSLEETLKSLNLELPKFDVGTNYVPRTMAAVVHEGEAIIPKAFNPWAGWAPSGGGDNAALVAEVRALREDNRQQAGEIARLNIRMARVLERWDGDGMPKERVEAV